MKICKNPKKLKKEYDIPKTSIFKTQVLYQTLKDGFQNTKGKVNNSEKNSNI